MQTITAVKLKIYVSVSTLENNVVKLFVATVRVVQKPWHRESAGMNGGGSLLLIVRREANRGSSVSAQLRLCGVPLKGPRSTDGHCLGCECLECY